MKKICVGVVYIAPRSKFKSETIQHVIETIHVIKSVHNDIKYCIFGDYNRVDVEDIIDSYGALQQVVKEPTGKDEVLDLILTDLHTDYHSPVSLPPLEVDSQSRGKDSDHNVILFPPIPDRKSYESNKKHNIIKTRPLSQIQIKECGKVIGSHNWDEVLSAKEIDDKVEMFHKTLKSFLDNFFSSKRNKNFTI